MARFKVQTAGTQEEEKETLEGAKRAVKIFIVLAFLVAAVLLIVPTPNIHVSLVTVSRSEDYVTVTYHLVNTGYSFATNVVAYIPVDKTLVDKTPPYVYGSFSVVPSSEWGKIGFENLNSDVYSLLMFDIGWIPSRIISSGQRRFDIMINTGGEALITTIGKGKLVYSNMIGDTRETVINEFVVNVSSL